MKMVFRVLVAGIALFAAHSALADTRATPDQAKTLLAKAVEKIQKDGPEKAFAAFNDRAAGYKAKELYVFAFDLNGKYMASGANPALAGTQARNMKDAEGKYLVREMIKIAKNKGHGEVEYLWLNRRLNRMEKKHSFIQRVGEYFVGVGYYVD